MTISLSFNSHEQYESHIREFTEYPKFITVRLETPTGEVTFFLHEDNIKSFEKSLFQILDELHKIQGI